MLNESIRLFLLKLARESIKAHLNGTDITSVINKDNAPSETLEDGACFVTLNISGDLRGCIGSLEAYRPLFDDVISNSLNAAFKDPRFAPVSKRELRDINIEISVLTPRKKVEYLNFNDLKKKIKPGVHGVYLSYAVHSATFLPQVWDQLPSHEKFFMHLSTKAGLSPDFVFKNKPNIETYRVEKFKE